MTPCQPPVGAAVVLQGSGRRQCRVLPDVVWMREQPLFCADTSPKRHSNLRSVMRHGVVMSRVVLRRSVLMWPERRSATEIWET